MRNPYRRHLAALAIIVLLLAVLVAAGCGREETTTSTASPAASPSVQVTKMAVITPEKANDYGWNQQGVESAQNAADSVGAELIIQDGAGYGDITPIMNQLAGQDPDFIIPWASGYNTVGPQMAQQLQIPVTASDPGTESANVPGLVNAIETNGENGGYLAGVLAGSVTKTGTVAIVVSAEDLNWSKMSGGFVAGVRSVSPADKILFVQIGQAAYADAAGGKRVTANAISAGADVIFGMGDGSSFGMMQAVETATPPSGADKVWFIDVIGDKTPVDKKGVLLSSVLWDFTQIFEEAIAQIQDGTFGTASYYLNLDNGMGLLQTQYIPDDVWTQIETAKAGILDGSIEVPIKTNSKQVKALIAAG
ncbi:MAG TPA: BMP family ABC transporter substrate-binding protein [Thermoleophilia bacterium]|nr:BMP family ABC transporter substrate-binding protein [Thermoleophilia bacterium]